MKEEQTKTYLAVPLLRNRIYPTYQLHAVMANRKTDLRDGLRLAALVTLEWVKYRLGEEAPPALRDMPSPEDYQTARDDALVSLHLSAGYVVDIVSMPEQGSWSLQITEPDLGPTPGKPDQSRQAVPGRVIETCVEFRIANQQLECGIKTLVSDPASTETPAEVYRLAIVKRLANHPDFGLKHLSVLTGQPETIDTAATLARVCEVWRDERNQMPSVVFTYSRPEKAAPKLPVLSGEELLRKGLTPSLSNPALAQAAVKRAVSQKPPYDLESFAKSTLGYGRVYLLSDHLLERFATAAGVELKPGDTVILEPPRFGGITVLPLRINATRQQETMDRLKEQVMSYPREKKYHFGNITFLSGARKDLMDSATDAVRQAEETAGEWMERMTRREAEWMEALRKKDEEFQTLTRQVERLRLYQDQIEKEKEELRKEQAETLERCRRELHAKDEDIAYLRRKLDRPTEHADIPAWVGRYFSGRLLLHQKAVALLEDRSAKPVDPGLICDALDFLATDYWERRYERITTDEMNSRCSEKYGRPFDVRPTGTTTIEFTPVQYKIKYFPGALGKPVESALDYHLSVGNDPGNLLRIYFLHDDGKRLIVVGSLPRHLKAVTIS